jgi:hypothetical protein
MQEVSMDDFDTIPVRLPSGSKAIVQLPRPFTTADAVHLIRFLAQYHRRKIGRCRGAGREE